ncbi:MAG: hypothetical protein AB7E52_06770 [Bdellovibrionales bacterium]
MDLKYRRLIPYGGACSEMKKIGEGVVNKSRDDLVALLYEWVKIPSMIEHSLAVEHFMRCYSKYYGEDEY